MAFVDRYEITSGVVTNEVSAHDLRDDGFTKPYIPIMSFLLKNEYKKFEVEFTIMTCDNIGSVSTYSSRYFFVHTSQGSVSTSFECLHYFGSNQNVSYTDVVYTLNGNVLTFYKKKSTQYDWFLNVVNYVSKIGITTGYATPTFYIGSRATAVKDYEQKVQASDFRTALEIPNMVLPTYSQMPCIVTVTLDSGSYSADMLFADVLHAIQSGRHVYYKCTIEGAVVYLNYSAMVDNAIIAETSISNIVYSVHHDAQNVILTQNILQQELTSDSTIDISNNVISVVGCKEVIRNTAPISRNLQPNVFVKCTISVSDWNPVCQNHIAGIECEYKGRFTADETFTVGGTDWEGSSITWSGDKNCIAGGVYKFSIIDNYGTITKLN